MSNHSQKSEKTPDDAVIPEDDKLIYLGTVTSTVYCHVSISGNGDVDSFCILCLYTD